MLTSSSLATFSTKHLLEFVEYVSERRASLLLPALFELAIEAFESTKALTEGVSTAAEGILSSKGVLRLLVTSHASLIVNSSLAIVTESLVSIAEFGELFLCLRCLVDIWMVFLCELEVCLLDISCRCVLVDSKSSVEVIAASTTAKVSGELPSASNQV